MSESNPKRGRLLIVEDQALVARDVEKRLSRLGYEVVGRCGKPDVAIEVALTEQPDLMLMDINLNADMDGIDVATRVREQLDVPVVYCTAYSDDEVLERAKLTSPYGYVLKPFEDRELEIAIDVALYKHRAQRSHQSLLSRISATLSSIGDGVVACDRAGRIFTMNPPAAQLIGINAEAAMNAPIDSILKLLDLQTRSDTVAFSSLISEQRALQNCRLCLVQSDGQEVPVEVTATPIQSNEQDDGLVVALRDISRQLQYETHIEAGAFTEPVTGLLHRNLFMDQLSTLLTRFQNRGAPFALLLVDIDRFRLVNDGMGSKLADLILKEVADRIHAMVPELSAVTRLNADVFGCIVENVHGLAPLEKMVRTVQQQVAKPISMSGHTLKLTASVGATVSDHSINEGREMLRDADTAKHQAKRQGPESFAVFEAPMRDTSARTWQMGNLLSEALDAERLRVHYQPIVGRDSETIVGMEALLRWDNDTMGAVGPSEFVPLAERIGLIGRLGDYVLERVCGQIALWRAAGLHPPKVHVNLSPLQFARDGLIDKIQHTLTQHQLEPACLGLEITESTAMADLEETAAKLRRCANAGISISIDDFGTGHSSLAYLKRLPLNTLKIDRSFVLELETANEDKALVKAVIAMAHELDLEVLAEGVETQEQARLLSGYGCDQMQGYFFGRPADADATSGVLSRNPGSYFLQRSSARQ